MVSHVLQSEVFLADKETGKDLNTMYISTAHSKLAQEGDIQDRFPHSGDVFKLDFSEESEVRKLLGQGWKGRERYRFAA